MVQTWFFWVQALKRLILYIPTFKGLLVRVPDPHHGPQIVQNALLNKKKPGEIQEKSRDYNKLHRMKIVLCLHLRYFWHTFPCLHNKNWGMSGDVGSNSWFRSRAPIYAIQTKVTSTAVLSTNKDVPTSWWYLKQSSSRKNGPKAKQTETKLAWKCLPFSRHNYGSGRNHPKWKETKNWRDPFSTSMIMGGRVDWTHRKLFFHLWWKGAFLKPTGQQVPLRRYQNSSSSKGDGTPVGLEMLWRFPLH